MPLGRLEGQVVRSREDETPAADPRWTAHLETPVWGCACSHYLANLTEPLLTVHGWQILLFPKVWARVRKLPLRAGFVSNLFALTDLFILSIFVLSRSWEKFLPKCTLTYTGVFSARKWCCFLQWLGLSVQMWTLSKSHRGYSIYPHKGFHLSWISSISTSQCWNVEYKVAVNN